MALLSSPPLRGPLAMVALSLLAPMTPAAAVAAPVVCNTTLEAPAPGAKDPVEVTRCAPVQSVPALVQQRFFTYTAPFAKGVSVGSQIKELFGISTGSSTVLGFPDQTIVWDGVALENTYGVLMEAQSDLIPWRTPDISNGFGCSLASPTGCSAAVTPAPGRGVTYRTPVRGLW
ncbi:MAG: Occludin/ELL family protein [Cyanobacteria bacterium K_DeepCast_35m_m2_023]|nr:Occludin/ELL family protein [Cyanobacteria bacterium K_DeepCast_35m_m2_023]